MQKFETFGARLKRLRAERGWSQRETGRRANISPFQLIGYEHDKFCPGYWTLLELARALDVSLDYLMLGEQHEEHTSRAGAAT